MVCCTAVGFVGGGGGVPSLRTGNGDTSAGYPVRQDLAGDQLIHRPQSRRPLAARRRRKKIWAFLNIFNRFARLSTHTMDRQYCTEMPPRAPLGTQYIEFCSRSAIAVYLTGQTWLHPRRRASSRAFAAGIDSDWLLPCAAADTDAAGIGCRVELVIVGDDGRGLLMKEGALLGALCLAARAAR